MIKTFQAVKAVEVARFHHFGFWTHDDAVDNLVFHFSFLFSGKLISFKIFIRDWTKSDCITGFGFFVVEALMDENVFIVVVAIKVFFVAFGVIEGGLLFWIFWAFILTFNHLTVFNDWNYFLILDFIVCFCLQIFFGQGVSDSFSLALLKVIGFWHSVRFRLIKICKFR